MKKKTRNPQKPYIASEIMSAVLFVFSFILLGDMLITKSAHSLGLCAASFFVGMILYALAEITQAIRSVASEQEQMNREIMHIHEDKFP